MLCCAPGKLSVGFRYATLLDSPFKNDKITPGPGGRPRPAPPRLPELSPAPRIPERGQGFGFRGNLNLKFRVELPLV